MEVGHGFCSHSRISNKLHEKRNQIKPTHPPSISRYRQHLDQKSLTEDKALRLPRFPRVEQRALPDLEVQETSKSQPYTLQRGCSGGWEALSVTYAGLAAERPANCCQQGRVGCSPGAPLVRDAGQQPTGLCC